MIAITKSVKDEEEGGVLSKFISVGVMREVVVVTERVVVVELSVEVAKISHFSESVVDKFDHGVAF